MQHRHLVVRIVSQDDGDPESWFRYYKFRPGDDDELYVVADGTVVYHEPKEGDVIWFQLEDQIYGGAPLVRVQDDPVNDRLELWYRGTGILDLPDPVPVTSELLNKISRGDLWEELQKQQAT